MTKQITPELIQRQVENLRISIMRFDFRQSSKHLSDLLNYADEQPNLPIQTNINSMVTYFIQSLSKKSQVDTLKDKNARLIWLRNYFLGRLISIITNKDINRCKSTSIALKELMMVLKYTQLNEMDDGIKMLWEKIISLFQDTPEKCENILQVFGGYLKYLYKLTASLGCVGDLMINVSFSAMSLCRSSIERNAKVQFFLTISRYGHLRYTNTMSILYPILEPLWEDDDTLSLIIAKECCEGLIYIHDNKEKYAQKIQEKQIYKRLDVNGVIQFMTEMIKEDTDKLSLCTYNYYLLFHTACFVGLYCDNAMIQTSAVDLLIEYLEVVLKNNKREYIHMLMTLINRTLEIFYSSKLVPLNNSCIRTITLIIENRIELLMDANQEALNAFNKKVNTEIQTIKDKREYIVYYASLLSSGKTQKEKEFLKTIMEEYTITLESIQQYFSYENSRQIQGVLLAITKILKSLIELGISNNTYLIPFLKQFLKIEPTQPPIVKQTFIHCLSSLPLKLLYQLIPLIEPNCCYSFANIILRLFNCFITDSNASIRDLAAQKSSPILLPTIEYLYGETGPVSLSKYSASTLTTIGIQRVAQLITISYMTKEISLSSENNHFLNKTCISRTTNPMTIYETPLLSNILSFVPYILNQSFDTLQPIIQINGLHAFLRIIRYLCRTPYNTEVSSVVNQSFIYIMEIIRTLLFVQRPEYISPYKFTLPIEALTEEMTIINARSSEIDNPITKLTHEALFALAVLLRRVQPSKDVIMILRLFLDDHVIPVSLALREIVRYNIKPYEQSKYRRYDEMYLEADMVNDFEISDSFLDIWPEVATMISSVFNLSSNESLKNKEKAVVTRCCISLLLSGMKLGKPNRSTKFIFNKDGEEDYIPDNFDVLYLVTVKNIENYTINKSHMAPKPQFTPHYALLAPFTYSSIDTLHSKQLSILINALNDIEQLISKGMKMNDFFLTILQIIEMVHEIFKILIIYTPEKLDEILTEYNLPTCAVELRKTGLPFFKIIEYIMFKSYSADNLSEEFIQLMTRLKDLNHCYKVCFKILLKSVTGSDIFLKLRGETIIPMYFISLVHGYIKNDVNYSKEFVKLIVDIAVEDAVELARHSTKYISIKEVEDQLKEIRPDIYHALNGDDNLTLTIMNDLNSLERTIEMLQSRQELSVEYYQRIITTFPSIPMKLIEALSYSCLNKKNKEYLESILKIQLPSTYCELIDSLSDYLPKKSLTKHYVEMQTETDFWKVQKTFEKLDPSLRDTARKESHYGQLMLYIIKKDSLSIISHAHKQFLERFKSKTTKNHPLFATKFDRLLHDSLWENSTPPANSIQQALQYLISLQRNLPISDQLRNEFIERLFIAKEYDLMLSCILQENSFLTFALDTSINRKFNYCQHYLETHCFRITNQEMLQLIKKGFIKQPMTFIRLVVACLPQYQIEDLAEIYNKTTKIVCGRSNYYILRYLQATISSIFLIYPEYPIIQPQESVISLIAFHHSLMFISQSLIAKPTKEKVISILQRNIKYVTGDDQMISLLTNKHHKNWGITIVLRFLYDLINVTENNLVYNSMIIERLFKIDKNTFKSLRMSSTIEKQQIDIDDSFKLTSMNDQVKEILSIIAQLLSN